MPEENRAQKRLMQRLQVIDANTLIGEIYSFAYNVEDALLKAGAVPGKDYCILDLFTLAQPFALEKYRAGLIVEYDFPGETVTIIKKDRPF